jgi:cellulose synthase/poly-beta-1,6-N-acetylglucosamine synthase-like glycosyltransferase
MRSPHRHQSKHMRYFSTLAGHRQRVPRKGTYTVKYSLLTSRDKRLYRYWTNVVAYGALFLALGLAGLLFWPSHWIVIHQPDSPDYLLNLVMLLCLILLQMFLIIGTYAAARATVCARIPVPVVPPKGLRVAFATTRAPGEPISMVRRTLQAMKHVQYKGGKVDVWLLDETKDPELKKICRDLRVRYFSRAGKAEWNTAKPHGRLRIMLRRIWPVKRSSVDDRPNTFVAARTKHGNFNAWGIHVTQKGLKYDVLAGVDTDHVPEPNFLERLLGYFHDEDVAFVVGPQVYGNYRPGAKNVVARWAESQASFFQSTIQPAGNASASPMFVGTNYAVRTSALHQIGGFQPCITEDMATGLAIHAMRNPATGKRWKSVYTPDVLAIGEGPDLWGPYFTQQWRWAAGTFDTWRRVVWRVFFKLSPRSMLHYFLMLIFYPVTALTWLLGMVSTSIYLVSGATAILAPWAEFVSLYLMSLVMQLSLYFWNRRFNVSPHEPPGSYGVAGMLLTSLAAPIYLSALIGVALGKKAHFVVTTKGGKARRFDALKTFRIHLMWALVLITGLAYGYAHDNDHPAMVIWAVLQLVICLLPPLLGWAMWLPARARRLLNTQLTSEGESLHA